MHFTREISLDSAEKTDFIDVTGQVRKAVLDSKVRTGIINIFTQHTTTAIRINENEKGLLRDTKRFLEDKCPPGGCYHHDDIEERPDVPSDEPINAHSHLKSIIMGASETIPIFEGEPKLGQWQSVFFVDRDGPRKRKMLLHIIGES
jgi:secondary thiamine-phosphate synthase enzyme